jgi:hypothetical protein
MADAGFEKVVFYRPLHQVIVDGDIADFFIM